MMFGSRGRHTISPTSPRATSRSSSSTSADVELDVVQACPPRPGWFASPGGQQRDQRRLGQAVAGAERARSRTARARSGRCRAASALPRTAGAGDPAWLGVVVGVGDEDRERAEHRRDRRAGALAPRARSPTPRSAARCSPRRRRAACRRRTTEIALKWNSGSGVSTTSSGGAATRRAICSARRDHVVVREHAALRRAGGARGVDEAREVGRSRRRRRAARSSGPAASTPSQSCGGTAVDRARRARRRRRRRRSSGSVAAGDLGDPAGEVALDDDDLGAGVGELVAEELALVRGVDRDLDRARACSAAKNEMTCSGPFSSRRRDPVAAADAERRRGRGPGGCAAASIARAVYASPSKSRYGPSGSDARRPAKAERTVVEGSRALIGARH